MKDMICPRCNSENIVKNGNTIYGKPKVMCGDCRKQFVRNPVIQKIPDEIQECPSIKKIKAFQFSMTARLRFRRPFQSRSHSA